MQSYKKALNSKLFLSNFYTVRENRTDSGDKDTNNYLNNTV